MVVVPTSTNVHLTYERSTLDYLAYLLTFLGIGLLVFMRIRGDVRHANIHPFGSESDPNAFQWDEWETPDDSMLIDPTPSELWRADTEDPLESDLDREALVWASPTEPPTDTGPPGASL